MIRSVNRRVGNEKDKMKYVDDVRNRRQCFMRRLFMLFLALIIFSANLWASESTTCKPYTEKELTSIKASHDTNLIMGAGVVDLLINPKSTAGKELLDLGSRTESPKRTATLSLIVYQLSHDSSLKPFREYILQLLRDDKGNAMPYYLNALLEQEEIGDSEALAQIEKGNAKIFNSYPKERFTAIADAAERAKCGEIQARQYAIGGLPLTSTYIKLRHLCQKLSEGSGQEAKKACFVMGQNLERGSLSCIEKVNSLSIQSNSLDDTPSNAAARAEIKKKREQALACGERRNVDISESDVSEDAYKQYCEIFLKSGEAAAQDFLSDFVIQKHKGN